MTSPLDPRVNAFRADLADARLRGRVEAARFVEGTVRRVVAPSSPLRIRPAPDGPLDSEVLLGELLVVFEEDAEGWSWVQNLTDRSVGYVASDAIGPSDPAPTDRVTALRTFVYPGPDMKMPARGALSFRAEVALAGEATTRGTRYRLLAGGEGAVVARHLEPVSAPLADDFVAVAERFEGVPYLWGGRTSLGLDCSSLVQLALAATGVSAPRDSDLQADALGHEVPAGETLRRGDLFFWPGHVAIATDATHMVHASGYHMTVVREPLDPAFVRIQRAFGSPKVKRL